MPGYRFYCLPRSTDERPDELTFFDDGAAMVWGLRRAGVVGVEVWEGGRFVGRLHAGTLAGAPDPEPALPEDEPVA